MHGAAGPCRLVLLRQPETNFPAGRQSLCTECACRRSAHIDRQFQNHSKLLSVSRQDQFHDCRRQNQNRRASICRQGKPRTTPISAYSRSITSRSRPRSFWTRWTRRKPLVLNASYQGCSDNGLCYPPIEKTFNVDLVQTASAATEPLKPHCRHCRTTKTARSPDCS